MKLLKGEVNVGTVIGLVIFLLIGVVFVGVIAQQLPQLTTPYYTTVSDTQTQTVANPSYVGSTGATLLPIVLLFFILLLLITPAVIIYKMMKS